MSVKEVRELARRGRLYPSTILYGGSLESRLELAVELARALLCDASTELRPCGSCRHCRRIEATGSGESRPGDGGEAFHPDVRVLFRDLKASTSVEATRQLLRMTQQHPFEARGQVLVVAEAETLTGEAANALLKTLEEPPAGAPRNFLLLAPAQESLLPTLRSRSWATYLGPPERLAETEVAALSEELGRALQAWQGSGEGVYLLIAASTLGGAGGWEDLRAQRPWATAAAAVTATALQSSSAALRRRLLALAQDLLEAPRWRLRSLPAQRILDGLVVRHLADATIVPLPSCGPRRPHPNTAF